MPWEPIVGVAILMPWFVLIFRERRLFDERIALGDQHPAFTGTAVRSKTWAGWVFERLFRPDLDRAWLERYLSEAAAAGLEPADRS